MVGAQKKLFETAVILCASVVVAFASCSTETDDVVHKQRLPGHLIGVDDLFLGEKKSELADRVDLDKAEDYSDSGGTEPSDHYYRVVEDNPMIDRVTYSIWNDEVVYVGALLKFVPMATMLRLKDSLIGYYGAPRTDTYEPGSQIVNWSVGDTVDVTFVYDPHPRNVFLGDSTVGGINWTKTGGSRK